LEKYVKKMERIAVLLELVVEELKEVREGLRAAVSAAPPKMEPAAEPAKIEVQEEVGPLTIEKVQSMFPEDLLGQLYFEDSGDSIIIRPRGYLGDRFREVAEIACDQLGGAYIGAGKNSYFKIPKE